MPSIRDLTKGTWDNLANKLESKVSSMVDVPSVKGKISSFTDSALAFQDGDIQKRLLGGASEWLGDSEPHVETDLRVRLRPKQFDQVMGAYNPNGNIQSILHETNGMLFPYTPSIEWVQPVDYTTTSLTHTIQDFQVYKSTPSSVIRISGDFTVQNEREATYMLAVFQFLRTISKMDFGKQALNAGMPPPVLLLSGYGDYMFNDLPVIVRDHSYPLSKDGDYVTVNVAGGLARVPVMTTISMTLVVQNTPKRLREDFNLEKFRTGQLMKSKGWI